MNTRNRGALVGALVLAMATAACIPDIEEPDVRIAGARLGGLGIEGGLVYVQLSVVNPNDFALETEALTYDVDFSQSQGSEEAWVDFAAGTFSEDVRVEENDSVLVEVPVEFSYRSLGGAASSILSTGTVDYRLRGTVHVAEPLRAEVPFEKTGTMSFGGANE